MTTIEWTEKTINPSTGCDRVSPGCDHCYALTLAGRLKAMGQTKYQTDGDPRTSGPGFGFAMHPEAMQVALRTRKPTMWFVNSMSDLFHAKATREFLVDVFATMAATPRHTYQILTKRALRMNRILADPDFPWQVQRALLTMPKFSNLRYWPVPEGGVPWPLPNVWLGTSVEDQERADERIPYLLRTPAAVRFLSCEPLLGPVDLHSLMWRHCDGCAGTGEYWVTPSTSVPCPAQCVGGNLPTLDWVIVGGESGRSARWMNPAWAQRIVNDCRAAGVPVFVKQLGSVLGGKSHHNIDTFPGGLQVREYPQTSAPSAVTA